MMNNTKLYHCPVCADGKMIDSSEGGYCCIECGAWRRDDWRPVVNTDYQNLKGEIDCTFIITKTTREDCERELIHICLQLQKFKWWERILFSVEKRAIKDIKSWANKLSEINDDA